MQTELRTPHKALYGTNRCEDGTLLHVTPIQVDGASLPLTRSKLHGPYRSNRTEAHGRGWALVS